MGAVCVCGIVVVAACVSMVEFVVELVCCILV